jgi:glutathione S-transferase
MIRILLHDQGVQYQEVAYFSTTSPGAPGHEWAHWGPVKAAGMEDGSIPFGQLPAFTMEDGTVIVQSMAIMRHLARKLKLNGDGSEKQMLLVDELCCEATDMRSAYSGVVYGASCSEEAKAAYFGALFGDRMGRGVYLTHIEAFAARHGGAFLIGDAVTLADYVLFEVLETQQRLFPTLLTTGATPKLADWFASFAARPNIAAYVASAPAHRVYANGNGKA